MANDPYVDTNGVLLNKLNITDQSLLDQAERGLSTLRLATLRDNPIAGNFDFAHLQAIHKHIFQDVYEWAGQPRTVTVGKGQTLFCPAENIPAFQNDIFSRVKADKFMGLDQDAFAAKAAEFLGDLNALHPFREGNGRAQRELVRQLAHEAGYQLDFLSVSQEEMIHASVRSMACDYTPLQQIISQSLIPLVPVVLDLRQERLQVIRNFSSGQSAQAEYLRLAKRVLTKGSELSKSDDKDIVLAMLKKGFEKNEIVAALSKKSPNFCSEQSLVDAKGFFKELSRTPEIQRALRGLGFER